MMSLWCHVSFRLPRKVKWVPYGHLLISIVHLLLNDLAINKSKLYNSPFHKSWTKPWNSFSLWSGLRSVKTFTSCLQCSLFTWNVHPQKNFFYHQSSNLNWMWQSKKFPNRPATHPSQIKAAINKSKWRNIFHTVSLIPNDEQEWDEQRLNSQVRHR